MHSNSEDQERKPEEESIYGGDTTPEDDSQPTDAFDDETQNPDLPAGDYPSDPNTGDATTPPADEARRDAEKPR